MELVLATKNLHKVREYRQMLSFLKNVDILSLHEFTDYIPPEETGNTFEENAILKAEDASQKLNRWVISDDSGLVVPALHGAPGTFSARYSGKGSSDLNNRNKLIASLEEIQGEGRSAYFECCIVLKGPQKAAKSVTGICEGRILEKERGSNGFGYDSLFIKEGYTKSFAELDETTKNKISHRRKALDKILILLETSIQN